MVNNVVQCQVKIKNLLENFITPKYPVKLEVYLDRFLKNLSSSGKYEVNTVITLPIFAEWITRAVTIWNSKGIMPSPMIVSFTLNLASLLSKNEERFNELNINNFYIKLINILKSREPYVAPPSKLAYIKLLLSLLEHKSGIEWMMACNFWEDIFQSCLTGQTNSIIAESQNFMKKFLDVTIDHDRNVCNKVVKQIMMPLGENIYMSIKSFGDVVNDEVLSQNLSVTLRLIGNILEYFLDRTLYDRNDFRIPLIFLKNFHLEQRISDFMLVAQNKHLAFDLGKIMFIMQFLELYVDVTKDPINIVMDTKSSVDRIINIFFMNMSKGNFDNVLKYCEFGHFYWNLMGSKIPHFQISDVNESIKIANRLIMFNCLPNFCLVLRYCRSLQEIEQLLEDPFRSIFSNKLHKIYLCVRTTRLIYIWRDRVQDLPNLFEIACTTLKNIKKSWKYFPREQATLIFQLFAYNLKDYLYGMEKNPELIYTFTKEVEYFALIFEVIAILIEQFHINWTDTVEACDVMSSAFDFLTNPGWPTKVTVNALKLVNVALDKYMSPNLTLLVDRVSDSTMAFLGPLLRNKLLYENWDVKNSAIEVVFTISRMSNNKFPSLQKVLMDSELPTLVVKMSTCDGESFVRATAIKCLQEMIQVEEIWNNILKAEDLPLKMRDILLNETEGIVRVEAATFMCIAYENQQFQPETLDTIYETMIYSSTTDLHWEVKVRALGFWDKVIKNHLQNQGMIDGSFPNVTFSKEHRKIVTLTDAEIRKRLQKVLNQLSSIGCLGVLVSAIKDDCDMEVSKTAVKITQSLVDLFKKYNVYGDLGAPTSPLPVENGVSSSVSMSSGISVDESMDSPNNFFNSDFTDEIINEIVNSKDVSLLKNVYSPSDYGSVVNYDFQVRKIISPNEFLQFTQQDLNNVIAEKKNWLNGIEDLGSLLDDMLKTYDDDVNNMDCY